MARLFARLGRRTGGGAGAADPELAAVSAAQELLRKGKAPSLIYADLVDAARRDSRASAGRYVGAAARAVAGDRRFRGNRPVWLVVGPRGMHDPDPEPITFARALSRELGRQVVIDIRQNAQRGRQRVVMTAVRGDLYAVAHMEPEFVAQVADVAPAQRNRVHLNDLYFDLWERAPDSGRSLASVVTERLEPRPLPFGARSHTSLELLGDPRSHHWPAGDAGHWSVPELTDRLRTIPNDSSGLTMWLASDRDLADPRLHRLIAHAAVPHEYLGLVAPGRGGLAWLEDRWVDPEALAAALRELRGGPKAYFLMIPEALAGEQPFAVRFFEANRGPKTHDSRYNYFGPEHHFTQMEQPDRYAEPVLQGPVIATDKHVFIERVRGTVVAATAETRGPRLTPRGPDGSFEEILRVSRDDAGAITGVDAAWHSRAYPLGAALVHFGDYVTLVEARVEREKPEARVRLSQLWIEAHLSLLGLLTGGTGGAMPVEYEKMSEDEDLVEYRFGMDHERHRLTGKPTRVLVLDKHMLWVDLADGRADASFTMALSHILEERERLGYYPVIGSSVS